ncbi:hypothetical protein A5893_05375 [Pedobacter psychrophilus]|uniref:Uncharacterized protein n=1 Tax=Pedobacter psychrophilus TaxID=1826909 RepID=A0A179DH87_9SPHI|nr:hypothetical protein [Pedobacter psychrophilus]OAQ40381.1 hypothetical protein A5893_05375 [Pedobacter psychrophilus]
MEERLEKLFEFISNNRQYNKALQERFYSSTILSNISKQDKIISLLYGVANTQSKPNIDKLAEFFKSIFIDLDCLSSFKGFIGKIAPGKPINFKSLFEGMNNQNGWGKKTSALFSKSIFHLHNGEYNRELKIWDDVPEDIDNFYLPVDAVIIAIFNKIKKSNWDFNNINAVLNKNYTGYQIEIWDDLWFWGFITQKGSGNDRKFEWNVNKYWALKDTEKDEIKIEEIRLKATEFLKIIA